MPSPEEGAGGSAPFPRRASAPAAIVLLAAGAGLVLLSATGCAPGPSAVEERAASSAEAPAGLEYVPPAPGTYELPPIQDAVDGEVLDTSGTERRLFDYLGDRYVLLAFVYTSCSEPRGCPLARMTFSKLHRRLREDPDLAERVRLVTLSFDPERDTPEMMRRYADEGGVDADRDEEDWVFLTTASRRELAPLLDGYGQLVVPEVGPDGRPTGVLSHVLKAFLIDRELRVRNIYSSDFLHPAVVANDLETLVFEEG